MNGNEMEPQITADERRWNLSAFIYAYLRFPPPVFFLSSVVLVASSW